MSKSSRAPTAPSTVWRSPVRAVDGEAELDQVLDHVLDLLFAGAFLHGDDHELSG